MDRDPLLAEHHIPSHLLGYNIQSAGRTRIIFYCIIPTCLELLAYIIHMTGDFALSYQHFYDKNSLYGGLTLLFVCLPAFIWFLLILLSPAQWPYTIPEQTIPKEAKMKKKDKIINGCIGNIGNFCQKLTQKEKWKFFGKLLLNLIIFPLAAIQRFTHKIFWSIEALFHDNGTYEHYDSIANACKTSTFELYYFVQAYAQSAPQIILQLYIILRQDIFRNYETTNLQVLSIIFSMINMSFITSSYQRFESQKAVGRHYPWATFNQIQKHKEKFRHSTSVTDMSRQSLKNDNKRVRRKSDYFPENDRILQRLQLNDDNIKDIESSSLISESSLTETKLSSKRNKEFFNFDNENYEGRSSQRNTFDIENCSDDFDNNNDCKINNEHSKINETNNKEQYNKNGKNKKSKRTSVEQKTSNNEIVSTTVTENKNATKSHEEHLTLFDNNNKEIFLASSSCIDPISKDTLNVTDDEKLKNCQKNNNESSSTNGKNNNNNNNEKKQKKFSQPDEDPNEENVKLIENGNKFYGSVAAATLSNSDDTTNREKYNKNFNDIENSTMLQNNIDSSQQQLNHSKQQEHNKEIEDKNKEIKIYNKKLRNSSQGQNNISWALADTIEHIGEEDLNLEELKKYEKYHQNQHQKLRNIKFSDHIDYNYPNHNILIDKPPESPPPSPPPTASSRTPSTTASTKNFYNNMNPFDLSFTKNTNNKRNSNPFERFSIYKDMLIYNAENYIVENVPHPPQFICDRVDQARRTATTNKSYSSANPNLNDLNIKIDKNTMNKYKLEKFPSPNKLHLIKKQHPTSSLSLSSSLSSSSLDTEENNKESKKGNSKSPNETIIPSEDTVDFFLPSRRKMLHGLEQDDFFGKCTGFFGWFMFIYMRMVSLSVFSVFYQFEFIYLILGHYCLMLIFLCIDIDNFKKNLKKFPFYIFLAYVYIFVIIEFKTHFKRVKLWYISYFIIVMIETFTITELWKLSAVATYDEDGVIQEYELNTYWWFNFLYSTTWGSFIIFICCLFVYYLILKPNDVILVEK